MTRHSIGKLDDAAVEAIRHVVLARDELEQAARPDGVRLMRQQYDSVIDDLNVIARAICDMAGGV